MEKVLLLGLQNGIDNSLVLKVRDDYKRVSKIAIKTFPNSDHQVLVIETVDGKSYLLEYILDD